MDTTVKGTIKVFKALSDQTRLRIFLLLMQRDLCVCELTFILEMSQSRVSHQLRLLRDADLVEHKREGHWLIYTVPPGARKSLEPLLRRLRPPESVEAALPDTGRLALCLREDVRKTKGTKRRPARRSPAQRPVASERH